MGEGGGTLAPTGERQRKGILCSKAQVLGGINVSRMGIEGSRQLWG